MSITLNGTTAQTAGSNNSGGSATTAILIGRVGNTHPYSGGVLVFIVTGRQASTTPVITPPAGFTQKYFADYTSDPFPSTYSVWYKRVLPNVSEPIGGYTFGVTPAVSWNIIAHSFLNLGDAVVSGQAAYTGNPGDPQWMRDPGYVQTANFVTTLPKVYWHAAVGDGRVNEFSGDGNRQFKAQIGDTDIYSTRLYSAGTYFIGMWPDSGTLTSTTRGRLRITRTAERQLTGRRATPAAVDLFGDHEGSAGTLTDPPVGTTIVDSVFGGWSSPDPTPNPYIATQRGDTRYTGFVKLVLTEPMYLTLDTYGTGQMPNSQIGVWVGSVGTVDPVLWNGNTLEVPYATSTWDAASVGFLPFRSATQNFPSTATEVSYATNAQQMVWDGRDSTAPSQVYAYSYNPSSTSPRRLGAVVGLIEQQVYQLRWPYLEGTATSSSASAVVEADPDAGLVALIPPPGGAVDIAYQASGGTLTPDLSGGGGSAAPRNVMLGNGTTTYTP